MFFIIIILFVLMAWPLPKKLGNKSWFRWLYCVVTPMPMLLLCWIPQDVITMMLWGPAYLAVLASWIMLIIWGFVFIAKLIGFFKAKTKPKYLLCKIVKALLIIAFFNIADKMVMLSRDTADEYAIRRAKEIQALVDKTGKCPEKIEGWEERSDHCFIWYGEYCAKYPVRYFYPDDDGRCFEVESRHDFDGGLFISGGVGQKLKAEFRGEGPAVPREIY